MTITCQFKDLHQRAIERGYLWEEVVPCIVGRNGDSIVVDTDHPAYPAVSRRQPEAPVEPPSGYGPGTELKKMLGRIGIIANASCSCNGKAKIMDFHGPRWCRENLSMLVGWLREEAEKRGLPFMDAAGRILIKTAIRRAEKRLARDRAGHK